MYHNFLRCLFVCIGATLLYTLISTGYQSTVLAALEVVYSNSIVSRLWKCGFIYTYLLDTSLSDSRFVRFPKSVWRDLWHIIKKYVIRDQVLDSGTEHYSGKIQIPVQEVSITGEKRC